MKQFDQYIKQSLDNFEAEYNPADWTDMQNRLNAVKSGKSSGIGKSLLIAASVIAAAGVVYYFSSKEDVTTAENTAAGKTEPIVPAKENVIVVQPIEPVKEPAPQPSAARNEKNGANAPVVNISKEPVKSVSEKTVVEAPVSNNENKTNVKKELPAEPQPVSAAIAFTAAFRTDAAKVCEGGSVQFTPENTDGASYKWYFGDGESSAEPNPKHTFAEPGTYTVKLRVTSKDRKVAEQKNTVIVAEKPSVRMDINPSEENILTMNFAGDADKASEWIWDFGDKQTSAAQNPEHKYRKYGKYIVSLTVKNLAGCIATTKEELNLQLNLGAPNGFDPNNDSRSTWMPEALRNGEYPVFMLTIYDKTGKQIFRTSDKNMAWDGKGTINGDTYKWIAIVKDSSGEEIPCQGLITIKY